jgi:hypothetical protein
VVLAALHLDVLLDQLPVAAVQEGGDRRTLGFQSKAGCPLPLADAKIGNEFAMMWDQGSADPLLVHKVATQPGLVVLNVLDRVDIFVAASSPFGSTFDEVIVSGHQQSCLKEKAAQKRGFHFL